jgi:hypothetical protein
MAFPKKVRRSTRESECQSTDHRETRDLQVNGRAALAAELLHVEALMLLAVAINPLAAPRAATARRTAVLEVAEAAVEDHSAEIELVAAVVVEIAALLANPTAHQLHRQPQQLAEATRSARMLLSRLLRLRHGAPAPRSMDGTSNGEHIIHAHFSNKT